MSIASEAGLGMVHQEFGFMRSYSLFFAEPGPTAHVLADLAVESAHGAGADRAEMIARETRAEMRLAVMDLTGAREDTDRLGVLLESEYEPRFAANLISLRAWLALREGDRKRAHALVEPGFERANGDYYNGVICLALGALSVPDRQGGDACLAHGLERLEEGALSCAAIWFHCFAIEYAARHDDEDLSGRYAAALIEQTKAEPLGLTDLAVRAAGARFGRNSPVGTTTREELIAAQLEGLRRCSLIIPFAP